MQHPATECSVTLRTGLGAEYERYHLALRCQQFMVTAKAAMVNVFGSSELHTNKRTNSAEMPLFARASSASRTSDKLQDGTGNHMMSEHNNML